MRLLITFTCGSGVEGGKGTASYQWCPTQMIPLEVFGSESAAADLFQQLQRGIDVTYKTVHQCDEQLGSNVRGHRCR